MRRIPSRLDRFKSFFRGFKSVEIALVLFFTANVLLYLLIYLRPSLVDSLSLSANRPWGIVTSAFVHKDLGHLGSNLLFFSIWCIFFVYANAFVDVETRRHSSKVFLWMIFISGFLADALLFSRWRLSGTSTNSWGASGVVYASAGVLMASALRNFEYSWRDLFKDKTGKLKRKFGILIWSIFIVTVLVLYVIQDPKTFLAVAPGVNVFAHGYGFLLGFFLYWPSFYFTSLRNRIKSKK